MERHAVARMLAIASIVFLVTACAPPARHLYEGPPRPESDVALLTSAKSVKAKVYGIDGRRVSGYEFYLEPGIHDVWIFVRTKVDTVTWAIEIKMYCGIQAAFKAGQTYRVRAVEQQVGASAAGRSVQVGATIIEEASGLEYQISQCSDAKPVLAD